jgi:uncharacterized protein (TIGR00299 family) protein
MQVHLDAIGGVAGDMFIAAVLDAFPDLREGMLAAIRAAGLPSEIACRVVEHRDDVMTGLRFLVEEPSSHPAHDHAAHHHHHTPFREIHMRLEASLLASSVREHAIRIFALLADVEGKVHGVPAEEVSFHELGGWDSIADMVGAAYLIDALNASAWTVSALPQGSGRVKSEHGWLPVPAPATALLLQGFELLDDGLPGERVTPTGAAILRHLNAEHPSAARGERQPRRLVRTGCGFGTKTFPGLSNVLRLLAFEEAESIHRADRVAQIAFEIDDQTPEDLAIALDRLRAHPAVLDVLQAPAFGKKGRLIAQVRILAQPDDLESVFDACFSETTTLGLRWQLIERRVLPRDQATMEIDGRSIRVKRAQRSGVITAKAESADLLSLKGGRREREAVRKAAEQAGLNSEGDK